MSKGCGTLHLHSTKR
uniref:Uncharacterized protein n=1 Tax=Arundo donax TaxID=35708 RepID=A0A0A9TUA9_ARUDO